MRRSIMIALIALLALVVAAPMAYAQPQEREPNPNAPADFDLKGVVPAQDPNAPDTDLASLGCDFDVGYVISGKSKTIELPDGGLIVTAPGQDVTLTNLETGKQVTFNITGLIFSSAPDENGIVRSVITGRNLALDPAGTFLNIGRFTFALDSDNPEHPIFETQEGKGQAIDVCALLS